MRQAMSPIFTAHKLKYITDLMNQNATHLVDKIKRDYIDKNEDVNLKVTFIFYD